MEFRGRNTQTPGTPASQPPVRPASSSFVGSQLSSLSGHKAGKFFKLGSVGILFAVTALVVALTFFVAIGGRGQSNSVNKDKFQAVFLNNGQVYFGNIKSINKNSVDLRNIYYLQTNAAGTDQAAQAAAQSNVSLVKLGCELHAPYDQMLINADQVLFWENIQDNSQVVKAISDYKKNNKTTTCSTQSQGSTQQAPTTSGQSTGQSTAPTPTPTPTPVKKP